MDIVDDWRYDIPNIMYVKSEKTAQELFDAFRVHLEIEPTNKGHHFAFVECTDNVQGYLYEKSWDFLILDESDANEGTDS